MQSEIDILRDVSKKLDSVGIAFMLTGSVAMSYYATPRMTRDIDIVVALKSGDTRKVFDLFGGEYYISQESVAEAILRNSMFNIIHLGSVIKVDFMVLTNTPFAFSEFERRNDVVLGDFKTTIISLEDLILSKLVWARESASEMQLRDVRNLLTVDCDHHYLRKWARDLNVLETLEALLLSDE